MEEVCIFEKENRERRKRQSQREIHIWVLGTAGLAEVRSQ